MIFNLLSLFLVASFSSGASLYPHLGVRFVLDKNVKVYPVDNPSGPLEMRNTEMAIVPCVVRGENGMPLTGPRGEVLVGIQEKVYAFGAPQWKEGLAPLETVKLIKKVVRDRRAQLKSLKLAQQKVPTLAEDMDCRGTVTEAVPLSALGKNAGILLKVNPAPSTRAGFMRLSEVSASANEGEFSEFMTTVNFSPKGGVNSAPLLLQEFHNSMDCLEAEIQFGGRKAAFLKSWEKFNKIRLAKRRAGEDPQSLKKALDRAMEIDVLTRTAMYEADSRRGCSSAGLCEKNIILLSLRNRAREQGYCRNNSSQYPPGVCVAIPEDQYNIWSEIYADRTYMTSCFLRRDRQVGVPPQEEAEWVDSDQKLQYRGQIEVFKVTAALATKIIASNDQGIDEQFRLQDFEGQQSSYSANALFNYYHPPAMPACYSNLDKVYQVPEAFVECPDSMGSPVYIPIRGEKILLETDNLEGQLSFNLMKPVDARQVQDSSPEIVPDRETFKGCTIDARRIPPRLPVDPAKPCNAFGLPQFLADAILLGRNGIPGAPDQCESPPKITYYRRVPRWRFAAQKTPQVICAAVEERGVQCQNKPVSASAKMGGVCETRMLPVVGGI